MSDRNSKKGIRTKNTRTGIILMGEVPSYLNNAMAAPIPIKKNKTTVDHENTEI